MAGTAQNTLRSVTPATLFFNHDQQCLRADSMLEYAGKKIQVLKWEATNVKLTKNHVVPSMIPHQIETDPVVDNTSNTSGIFVGLTYFGAKKKETGPTQKGGAGAKSINDITDGYSDCTPQDPTRIMRVVYKSDCGQNPTARASPYVLVNPDDRGICHAIAINGDMVFFAPRFRKDESGARADRVKATSDLIKQHSSLIKVSDRDPSSRPRTAPQKPLPAIYSSPSLQAFREIIATGKLCLTLQGNKILIRQMRHSLTKIDPDYLGCTIEMIQLRMALSADVSPVKEPSEVFKLIKVSCTTEPTA